MPLDAELALFRLRLPDLLGVAHGQWLVVKDGRLDFPFATYEDALKFGYDNHGLGPFLVKRIVPEVPLWFSRPV